MTTAPVSFQTARRNLETSLICIHRREGWTLSYLLESGSVTAGFGSVAIGGPWKDKPTVFEFYVYRSIARGRSFCSRLFSRPAGPGSLKSRRMTYCLAATGGILFHYNRPYGDIYMEVTEPFRRRGLGTYLVQELKRVCYELGATPGARCNTTNIASRHTLQRAGFVPVAHILIGSIK